jgi:hypothetical protein
MSLLLHFHFSQKAIAEERRGKKEVRTDIRVVQRVYDGAFRAARNRRFRTNFACDLYNMENGAMRSRLLLLIPLILFGCALTTVKRPWKLELVTSGGFTGKGTGSVTIDSDRAILVTSPARAQCSFTASADELRRYESLLSAARPQAWSASYAPENRCCDRIDYDLTFTSVDRKYTTEWISAPRPMPKDLTAIGDALLKTIQDHSCNASS